MFKAVFFIFSGILGTVLFYHVLQTQGLNGDQSLQKLFNKVMSSAQPPPTHNNK